MMTEGCQRILIIGCGGSGKSTLARKLGEAAGLPVVHLDRLYWKPNWEPRSKEEFDAALQNELLRPRWIIDGNFNRTIPMRLMYCDAVIFMDIPRIVCLLSVIKRVMTHRGRTREDMGDGCPERFDVSFLKWVWGFNAQNRQKYIDLLQESGKTVYHVRSRRELPELIRRIAEGR